MRHRLPILLAALLLAPLLPARAGEPAPPAPDVTASGTDSIDATPAAGKLKATYEIDADTSYVGSARSNFGSGKVGNLSEERANARFIDSLQYNDGPIYRFGLGYERYSFGFSKAAPMPDLLEADYFVLGIDFNLLSSWLVRIEADPGFYGDGRGAARRDFNVPITLGGSYIASEELQWALGVGIDFDRQIPVFPAVGVRWQLNDDWVLDAILPDPRLEYDWSNSLTLYLGSDVDDGTYRVNHGVGAALGRPKLSNAVLEYDEIRIGAGFTWKASKVFTFELEGGYLPYREFDYHRADTHFSNNSGAPYGQFSLNAQF
jgi:hypothetical protein